MEDLRNTQKAFYVHGSTKLNIKILIVSCATKWLIFQNSVTYVYLFVFPHPREQTFYLELESSPYTNNKV